MMKLSDLAVVGLICLLIAFSRKLQLHNGTEPRSHVDQDDEKVDRLFQVFIWEAWHVVVDVEPEDRFSLFDRNNDSFISQDELVYEMKKLVEKVAKKDFDDIIKAANYSIKIANEMIKKGNEIIKSGNTTMIEYANGIIKDANCMVKVGYKSINMEDTIKQFMEKAIKENDKDGDGKLNFEEFTTIFEELDKPNKF